MLLEEKKAIEELKDFKSIRILDGKRFIMFLEQLKKYQEATDTVLNLIEKLQEENKVFKSALDRETADRSNDLLELQKKDKIIDLMAEQLAGLTIWDNEKEEPLILTDKDEVKQYFEKLAKEEGE